ncbi:MAG: energy transducer TonB [Thiohalocapsa sp.]|nr:energy transducer TonB [Thiohalocapsa sp.]MCF7991942.1 energy transducer TonB [Thiohalocapsa sp.]
MLEVIIVKSPGQDRSPDEAAVAAQVDRAADTRTPLPELEPLPPDIEVEPTEPEPEPESVPESEPEAHAPQPSEQSAPPAPAPAIEPLLPIEPLLEPVSEPATEQPPEPIPETIPEPVREPVREPAPEMTDPLDILEATPEPRDAPAVSAADILASRSAEIQALAARIDAQSSAYAQRTRRKAISTSTREYRYAAYMEAWRRKVERIGNLNYPQEAKQQGLYGNLILHVALRADGSLEGVRVVRSSGHPLLDRAAVRIVELAAPFAPFPADIRAETDVLDITRTWQFQRNNRLGWDN